MLGQQVPFPGQPSLAKTAGQHWRRLLLQCDEGSVKQ